MNEIDIELRHVTKPGANLFEELGFAGEEARLYDAAAQKEIAELLLLKDQLMGEIAGWIKAENLKQGEAARILQVTRPRISDVVNRKSSKFTIDALVNMLTRIGKPVRLIVG